jgi:hypothetical protein
VGPGVGNGLSTVQPVFDSPCEISASLVDVGLIATAVAVGIDGLVAEGVEVSSIVEEVLLLQPKRITIDRNRVREIFFKLFPPMSDCSHV